MGLEKKISEHVEIEHVRKVKSKEKHKQVNKKSTASADILKRLEIIEEHLGLDKDE